MHHLAWRIADEAAQLRVRRQVAEALFELATDGPGFPVDEAPGTLGQRPVLPPGWSRGAPRSKPPEEREK